MAPSNKQTAYHYFTGCRYLSPLRLWDRFDSPPVDYFAISVLWRVLFSAVAFDQEELCAELSLGFH
eukprot:scaffold596837_cov79-Attheya_sp.AAC.1